MMPTSPTCKAILRASASKLHSSQPPPSNLKWKQSDLAHMIKTNIIVSDLNKKDIKGKPDPQEREYVICLLTLHPSGI